MTRSSGSQAGFAFAFAFRFGSLFVGPSVVVNTAAGGEYVLLGTGSERVAVAAAEE